MSLTDNLEAMLASGKDNALLRFSLGKAYLDQKKAGAAISHLRKAVELDPRYSAAWKTLGKALHANRQDPEAREVLLKGIDVAREKGDMQALREMQVYLKRLEKD